MFDDDDTLSGKLQALIALFTWFTLNQAAMWTK